MDEPAKTDWGPFRVQPHPRALARFALGSSCTIALLLCIPDAFGLLPVVANPGIWLLRMFGLFLSALLLWFLGFYSLLLITRFIGGGLNFNHDGLRLWRFGKRMKW